MSDAPHLWAEIASIYDRTRAFGGDAEEQVPRLTARVLRDRGATRVLDLGCGTGRFALRFAEEGLRVVAADRSAEMLAHLTAKRRDARLPVVRCDACRPPFRDGSFDAMFTSHVLHLVPSVEDLADALRPVLRSCAVLVDADTTHVGDEPATTAVVERVFPRLDASWTPWPRGDGRSRMLDLIERFTARLGGASIEVVPAAEWTVRSTLREALDTVRARTWSSIRVHAEDRVLAAAAAVERELVAAGRDLDAPVEGRQGVRLLVARLTR